MKAPRDDRVFLVRMWREQGSTDQSGWRGSVHDVLIGRRLYLTSPVEVADFITVALRENAGPDAGENVAPDAGKNAPIEPA